MRILIIEDEETLAQTLKTGLENEGYAVDCVVDGEAGQKRIELYHQDYDIVILDLTLPKRDGVEILKNIRSQNIAVPVLVLTGRDGIDDKVKGLESGADDYLAKPFSFDELLARLKTLVRRPKDSLPQKLAVKDLVLDPVTRRVQRGFIPIALTLKEYSILEYLMRNKNQVVDREKLFSHVWDFESDSFSNVIDVHIRNIRKKIDGPYENKLVETIRGIGYRIKE